MHISARVNSCLVRTLFEGQAPLKTTNICFTIGGTKLAVKIIIVPLSEILDNIYQLLTHGPVCQSSHFFTSVQRIHTSKWSFQQLN